jgi:hypothetical protein
MFVLFLAVLFASDLITWTIRRKPRAESELLRVARNPSRIDANRCPYADQVGISSGNQALTRWALWRVTRSRPPGRAENVPARFAVKVYVDLLQALGSLYCGVNGGEIASAIQLKSPRAAGSLVIVRASRHYGICGYDQVQGGTSTHGSSRRLSNRVSGKSERHRDGGSLGCAGGGKFPILQGLYDRSSEERITGLNYNFIYITG